MSNQFFGDRQLIIMNLVQVIAVYMVLLLSSAKTTHIISSTSTLLAQTIAEDVNKSWVNVNTAQKNDDNFEAQFLDLNSAIKELNSKLEFIQSHSISFTSKDTIYAISKTWNNIRTELRLNDLADLISRLNSLYQYFTLYNDKQHQMENITIINLALSAVSHEFGAVPSLLDRIYDLLGKEGDNGYIQRGVISILTNVLMDSDSYVCDLKQSKQQLLYNFYDTLLLAEIKGYSMMQFSWMILKLYGKGNFALETDISRQRHIERVNSIITSLKSSLEGVSRQFWRCDPDEHVEGKTYTQLTRLLQGYIENEVDMNDEGTCRETCGYYQNTKNHGCYGEEFCSRQPACTGRIYNCRFVESHMSICMARRDSNRRYEWIQYNSGQTYGKNGVCNSGMSTVKSWWRWIFWHCSYCFCVCDQSGPLSDRYFSLKEVTSNISQNMVITGLRFVKINRVIHLQISQGKLLPGSIIDTKTVRWLDVTPMNLRNASKSDYHELSYKERGIDLDDLEGPSDHLLTGVRFRRLGSHINFEIQVTPFNYKDGKLDINKSVWVGNDTYSNRSKLYIGHPDVPTATSKSSTIDSRNYQYLEFDHTGFKTDFAQTTVPFIDTQDVMPTNPVPLTGAGIYHKGTPEYGGFIAPKVFTYDYSKHVEDVHFTTENEMDGDLKLSL